MNENHDTGASGVGAASGGTLTPAAMYVRMSTEHQQYSTENQGDTIRQWARKNGYEIIEVFADEGKSGLDIAGRAELQRLLQTVTSGKARFKAILAYDVSRWGRFQDADESAHYEYLCRKQGIEVHYCAEQFKNDGSIGSTLIKTVKRSMAGEYSRELSVKVFAGQCRLIGLGLLLVNREILVSLVLSRCTETAGGRRRWKIRLEHGRNPDLTIAVRMDSDNEGIHDYYLLPTIDMNFETLRLADDNGAYLDVYRQSDLSLFYEVAERVTLRAAA